MKIPTFSWFDSINIPLSVVSCSRSIANKKAQCKGRTLTDTYLDFGTKKYLVKCIKLTLAESYQAGRGLESILGQSGVYWLAAIGRRDTWESIQQFVQVFHHFVLSLSFVIIDYQHDKHLWIPISRWTCPKTLLSLMPVCLADKIL